MSRIDPAGALVFCNTREDVSHLQANLSERGFAAVAISGELTQSERTRALQSLRDRRARVLVATDVAARGLDLPALDVVIHADLPYDAQIMLHRSGRTGRAGRKGIAILVVPAQKRRLAERLFREARIEPLRGTPPSADAIVERDKERLVEELTALAAAPAEEDIEVARQLLATSSAENLVAVLVAGRREQLPAPEDMPMTMMMNDRQAPRPPERARETENAVWFRINVGRVDGANPRWLLPLVCRRGHVTKHQLGRIQIGEEETRFEVIRAAADSFEDAAKHPDRRNPGVRIGRVPAENAEEE